MIIKLINIFILSIALSTINLYGAVNQNISNSQDSILGKNIVWDGINAFYNYEFVKSVEILSKAKGAYPNHPAVHFVWGTSEWLRTIAYEGHEKSYSILKNHLMEIIPIYEELTKQFPDNPQYGLFLGSAHGLKARIHLGKKEWFGVLYEGYTGYRIVKEIHKTNPDLGDAYLPLGILNFYVGSSSKIIQFVAGLLGVEGDRELGINQIKTAARTGEYSWIEAETILAFIYLWIDEDYNSSLQVVTKLRDHFPGSFYYQHLYTESLIRLNKLDRAEQNLAVLDSMLEHLPPNSKRGWKPSHIYQKALLQFYKGDYNKAMKLVDVSIKEQNTEFDTNLAFAYVLRGKLYDLTGERRLAMTDYHEAIKLDNYTSAVREAEIYLKSPFKKD